MLVALTGASGFVGSHTAAALATAGHTVRALIRPAGTAIDLQVTVRDGKLLIEPSGALPILDFEKGAPITVAALSRNVFVVDDGDHTRLAFSRDGEGKATSLVLNPGPWEIIGQRSD